jgi:glycosyltransferase involved in cell wall biosynthesis
VKLTVVNVAFPLASVGPRAVGGAEQVLSCLDAALTRAEHRSIVLASEGSSAAGDLVSMPRVEGTLQGHQHTWLQRCYQQKLAELLATERIDVVHFHGLDFHAYLPPPPVPVLVTLHLPPAWHWEEAFQPLRPATFLQCVSQSQQRTCPAGVDLLPVIENGVPLDRREPARKGGFVVSLGRICPEKGVHLAIDAAEQAGVPLAIAGRVFPFEAHQRYFRDHVAPRLGRRCRFVGGVGGTAKGHLLRTARALLITSMAPETSSLVAMEALAAGTPVIAFPVGALPDIVEHGVTGLLVRDVAEMADAIGAVGDLDPQVCWSTAQHRFSAERMTSRYLERYAQLARGEVPSVKNNEPRELDVAA